MRHASSACSPRCDVMLCGDGDDAHDCAVQGSRVEVMQACRAYEAETPQMGIIEGIMRLFQQRHL